MRSDNTRWGLIRSHSAEAVSKRLETLVRQDQAIYALEDRDACTASINYCNPTGAYCAECFPYWESPSLTGFEKIQVSRTENRIAQAKDRLSRVLQGALGDLGDGAAELVKKEALKAIGKRHPQLAAFLKSVDENYKKTSEVQSKLDQFTILSDLSFQSIDTLEDEVDRYDQQVSALEEAFSKISEQAKQDLRAIASTAFEEKKVSNLESTKKPDSADDSIPQKEIQDESAENLAYRRNVVHEVKRGDATVYFNDLGEQISRDDWEKLGWDYSLGSIGFAAVRTENLREACPGSTIYGSRPLYALKKVGGLVLTEAKYWNLGLVQGSGLISFESGPLEMEADAVIAHSSDGGSTAGKSLVMKTTSTGFLDLDGKEVIPAKYRDVKAPSEDRIPVSLGGDKWEYINYQGKSAFAEIFLNASSFLNGKAVVLNGVTKKWDLIDKTGARIKTNILISGVPLLVRDGQKTLLLAGLKSQKTGKHGAYDLATDRWIVEPEFDDVWISSNFIRVERDNLRAIYSLAGDVLIDFNKNSLFVSHPKIGTATIYSSNWIKITTEDPAGSTREYLFSLSNGSILK